MRLQFADPADHPHVTGLPFATDLEDWNLPHMHGVLGLHRHVVRLVELGDESDRVSYVVKQLPDPLALREYRLLRSLAEDRLPTVTVVAAVTERSGGRDGLLITRHLDYSLPYRTLLSGRGLAIPYLGDRLLDALVGLLVRLHLAGFYWGDCSLSNTLFRRDAGELAAYVVDVETSERYDQLSDGQRRLDVEIATENVAGGLLDLQVGGRLVADIDPWEVAADIEARYENLWRELTEMHEYGLDERWRVQEHIEHLHDLGFDVTEMEVIADVEDNRLRFSPRVVESGYHQDRLFALTGISAGENQARRLLADIHEFRHDLQERTGRPVPENIAAVRWLDQRFEPILSSIPPGLIGKFEQAEIFHQLLEHRWFMSEAQQRDVPLEEAVDDYVDHVLAPAPSEHLRLEEPTGEFFLPDLSSG